MALEYEAIQQIGANMGFPIAAFVLMYRLVTTTIKENTEALKELRRVVDSTAGK